jgi:hypothetical protein
MPYIGNTIRAADDYRLIDDISSGFNGSETDFALQVAGSSPVPFPKSPQQVLISVNGVIQEPDPTGASGFNLVGTNIVFSSPPTNGHAFFGIIYATADYLNAGGNFPSGSLGAPSFTFIGDENTGLYRKSGGSVGFVSDATEIANFDSNGITISSGNLIVPDSIIHGGDSNTKIRFPAADTVSVETGGSERLRVTSTGTVGIGATSIPTGFQLAVNGDLTLGEASGSDNTFIDQKQNGSLEIINSGVGANDAGQIRINRFNNISGGTSNFRDTNIYNGKNTSVMYVDGSASSVGIGTTSPDTPLHVKNSANILTTFESTDADALIEFKDNSTSDSILVGALGGDDLLLRCDAGNLIFNLGDNSEKARFDSSGRLLIGTTTEGHSSADDLTIAGSGQVGITIRSGTSNDGAIFFSDGTSGTAEYRGFVQYNQPNDKLNFGTSSTVKLSIDSSGHVLPAADSTYNIGSNSVRFANGYFDTLYGDGSNLTGISSVGGSTGVDFNDNVQVRFGTGNDAAIKHDGYSTLQIGYSDSRTSVSDQTPSGIRILNNSNTTGGLNGIYFASGGAQANVGIFAKQLDNATASTGQGCDMIFYTKRNGQSNMAERAKFTNYGHFVPATNNTYDLGSTSLRWANIFTADLNLSNKGSQNDVDSTWGDYTIQEGYADLYLINNRTGKKFKFNLTEVS